MAPAAAVAAAGAAAAADSLLNDLKKAVLENSDASDREAATKYALLKLQLAIAEQQLQQQKKLGGKSEKASDSSLLSPLKKLLGLDVIGFWTLLCIVTVGLLAHGYHYEYFDPIDTLYQSAKDKCIYTGEDIMMEMARTPVNCEMCRNLRSMPEETNITKEKFKELYAYSSKPVLIKKAVIGWKALDHFSQEFFRKLYDSYPDSYQTQNENGQFFAYKTEFTSLKQALHISEERKKKSWYFGWSNADENVGKELREYYSRPHYLPDDAESSKIDWMFMGKSAKGAQLHIDYVSRPSWQAQIKGRKIWELVPSPECSSICHSFNVTVFPGDIINIDTNRWYHATYVYPGDFSVTIGSEYD